MDLIIETLMEFILELIFDGAFGLVTSKKIPLFIRVLAAVLLFAFYIGFGGILLYIGIKNRSIAFIAGSVVLLLVILIVVIRKYKEIRG